MGRVKAGLGAGAGVGSSAIKVSAAEAVRPEHAQDRLLRPLPGRPAVLGLQDRVALRQVLDGAHQDGRERLEDPFALDRHRRNAVGLAPVERAVQDLHLRDLREVALVVLEDERHRGRVEVMGQQILRHLPVALEVLFPAVHRGVGHEDEGVGTLQDQPARGGVHGLAGDGQDLQPQVEPAEPRGLQGQQVEEDGPVLGGVDGDHLPAAMRVRVTMDHLQVGGLPARGRGRSRRS